MSCFKPGDRVVGVTHPEDPDSIETARGLGNLSRNLAIPGHQAFGSYAQYLVRDERMWLPLPDGVDYEQAGVALWPFSSSHRVVHDRLKVRLCDTVLIAGASGGMGQATMQLASSPAPASSPPRGMPARPRCCASWAPMPPSSPPMPSAPVPRSWRYWRRRRRSRRRLYRQPRRVALLGSVMRFGGSMVISSEQGREPMPFSAVRHDPAGTEPSWHSRRAHERHAGSAQASWRRRIRHALPRAFRWQRSARRTRCLELARSGRADRRAAVGVVMFAIRI